MRRGITNATLSFGLSWGLPHRLDFGFNFARVGRWRIRQICFFSLGVLVTLKRISALMYVNYLLVFARVLDVFVMPRTECKRTKERLNDNQSKSKILIFS